MRKRSIAERPLSVPLGLDPNRLSPTSMFRRQRRVSSIRYGSRLSPVSPLMSPVSPVRTLVTPPLSIIRPRSFTIASSIIGLIVSTETLARTQRELCCRILFRSCTLDRPLDWTIRQHPFCTCLSLEGVFRFIDSDVKRLPLSTAQLMDKKLSGGLRRRRGVGWSVALLEQRGARLGIELRLLAAVRRAASLRSLDTTASGRYA
uniref:Uncharacterized protein n=1 Tax=Plectus sambesii TaxID=2011161 RepID=A0A914WQY8_9BILA